eukprot:GSA120T00002288001.1
MASVETPDANSNRADDVGDVPSKKLPVKDLSDAVICYVVLPEDDAQPLLVSEIRARAARAKNVPPEHIGLVN